MNYICVGPTKYSDKIFRRSTVLYIDRDETLKHLLDIPKAKIGFYRLYNENFGYDIELLSVPNKYLDRVPALMDKLDKALMIKNVSYKEESELIMGALIKMLGLETDSK